MNRFVEVDSVELGDAAITNWSVDVDAKFSAAVEDYSDA